jgi:predicted ArsR family transcriptional regulator
MQAVTTMTRQLSFEDIKEKRQARYDQILNLLGNRKMTTRELANELHLEVNSVRPRVTELEDREELAIVDTKKCEYTGKTVAVYERI